MSPLTFISDPMVWLTTISRVHATTTAVPCFALDLCVRKFTTSTRLDLSSLTSLVVSAEPVRAKAVQDFITTFCKFGLQERALWPSYGLAEHVAAATSRCNNTKMGGLLKFASSRNSATKGNVLISVGTRWAEYGEVDLRVVNVDTFTEVEPGDEGEIWLHSAACAMGYWNLPDLTQAQFKAKLKSDTHKEYLRTGDLGFVEDGHLFISGRFKELIIIRGEKHYLHDLETAAQSATRVVRPGCVVATPITEAETKSDTNAADRILIIAEVREREQATIEVCRQIVEKIKAESGVLVTQVVLIPTHKICKTSSGKIQRTQTAHALQTGEIKALLRFSTPADSPS